MQAKLAMLMKSGIVQSMGQELSRPTHSWDNGKRNNIDVYVSSGSKGSSENYKGKNYKDTIEDLLRIMGFPRIKLIFNMLRRTTMPKER